MILYLARNKNDVDTNEIRVPTSKGKSFAEEHNMIFYETSAKTGAGVKELFQAIATKQYELLTNK